MLGRLICAGALSLALLGCQTTQSVWVRADGRPASASEFELDKTVCEGAVAQTDVQGGQQYCRGIAGCAVTGFARGMQLNKVREGCMASRGYVLRQVPTQANASQVAEAAATDPSPAASSEPAVQQATAPEPPPAAPQAKRPAKQVATTKPKQRITPADEAALAVAQAKARAVAAGPAAGPPEPQLSEADRALLDRNTDQQPEYRTR